jgi:hypothetical protein
MNIEELARQAGLLNQFPTGAMLGMFERFADLVLEQAAQKCDDAKAPWGYQYQTTDWVRGTDDCAEAIRAMKPTQEKA